MKVNIIDITGQLVIDYKAREWCLLPYPKYPTRFPTELVGILIEHFSDREHTILDPMCGSGIVGVVNELKYHRKCYLGDLNPNSQLVCDSLLKFFKERLK